MNNEMKSIIGVSHLYLYLESIIPSIIKYLVYYTPLGIVKINIFDHFKKYLNSTNIFLETDNNFTQW